MSEQTANLCTTDACESLRARLAKYEDAEGRPVGVVVADRESIRRQFDAFVAWPGSDHSTVTTTTCLLFAEQIAALVRAEYATKSQGVVLPERKSPGEDMQVAGWNACIDEVARLNSSPVSVSEHAEEAFEEYARPLGFDLTVPRNGDYIAAQTVLAWEGFKAGAAWKARAALTASAPNHSEQVPVAYVDDHYLDQLRNGRGFSIGVTPAVNRRDGENNALYTKPCADSERIIGELAKAKGLLEECITTLYCQSSEGGEVLDRVNAFLAAAPSAGSQEQGE